MIEGAAPRRTPLRELAALFATLGTVAFGGPAAHVAMMEDEVVRRRGWMTREDFLDHLSAANLIPGPNSTELALHVGLARAGIPGLLVAGLCFVLPAALIVGAIAWVYVHHGATPAAEGLLYGVKPVVIAVVAQALWRLGRTALRTPALVLLAAVAAVAVALGVHELAVLLGAAVVAALAAGAARRRGAALSVALGAAGPATFAGGAATAAASGASAGLWTLFAVFLKTGGLLFGSGYVLLAFLRADLVERLGWLSERQLLDAIAVGQVTPGPLFTTATFVGYLVAGWTGAVVATVGIFLPAFVYVIVSGPLVPRIRRSPVAGAALDGVNAASLALMAVVSLQLGRSALVDPLAVALSLASLLLLLRWNVNSAWLVAGAAAIGALQWYLPHLG